MMKSLYLLVIALFISSCVFQTQAFENDFADDDHLALLELSLHVEQEPTFEQSTTPASSSTDASPSSSQPTPRSEFTDSSASTPAPARATPAAPAAASTSGAAKNTSGAAKKFKPVDPEKFAPPPLEQMPIPEVEPMNPLAKTSVEKELAKAQQLYTTLLGQITREQDWARSVNEIIQNYQFKYSKVLKDVKTRKDKIQRVRQLISLLKKAQLHKMLEGQLMRATEVLGSMADSSKYGGVATKVSELRNTLNKLAPDTVGSAVKAVDDKLVPIVTDVALPSSNDAVKSLLSDRQ